MAPKKVFEGLFRNFLVIKTHNFVKNNPKIENKSLFDANFSGACHENICRSQSSGIWSLRPKN